MTKRNTEQIIATTNAEPQSGKAQVAGVGPRDN